jgi:hypothetical protein
MIFNYFYLSASVALVQEEVRPNQRVLSGALLLLVMNFIGLGLGPDMGRLQASDWFKAQGDAHALQTALLHADALLPDRDRLFLWLARRPAPRGWLGRRYRMNIC